VAGGSVTASVTEPDLPTPGSGPAMVVGPRLVAAGRTSTNERKPAESAKGPSAPGADGGSTTAAAADEAWGAFETVPEVTTLVRGEANLLSQCRFYPGIQVWEDGELRDRPLRDSNGDLHPSLAGKERLVAAAEDELARYVDDSGSQAGLIRPQSLCWSVVGAAKIVGWQVDADGAPVDAGTESPDNRERWVAVGPSSVTREGTSRGEGENPITVKVRRKESLTITSKVVIHDLWQAHPLYPDDAFGWVMAALDVCRDLTAFTRAQRSAARSGIPADLFLVPLEASPKRPQAPAYGDQQGIAEALSASQEWAGEVEELLGEFILGVLDDVDQGNEAVPGVLAVESRFIEHFQSRSFRRDVDRGLRELIEQARKRLAESADGEPEVLGGLGGSSRWATKGIAEDAYRRYYKPKADAMADSWTGTMLWNGLMRRKGADEAPAFPFEDVRRIRLLVDASPILTPPDYSKIVPGMVDRLVIGPSGARKLLRIPEWAAATPQEREQMLEAKRGKADGGDGAAPSKVPDQGDKGPPDEVKDVKDPPAEQRTVAAAVEPEPTTEPLSLRLLAVEQGARARLEEAAEAALDRALDRGANRLAAVARRRDSDPATRRRAAAGPEHLTLDDRRAAFAVLRQENDDDDDATREVLFAIALAALLLRFRDIADDAYTRALTELGADLPRSDINAAIERGVIVLNDSMLLLAERDLFGVPGTPSIGEDVGLRVPIHVLRRALAVAGGALGLGPSIDPDLDAANGLVWGPLIGSVSPPRAGLTWVYGLEARRQPFEPHLALDGETFAGPTDDRLAGSMFGHTSFWHPGDHGGCRCDWMVNFTER
jgi:hypothetical protein